MLHYFLAAIIACSYNLLLDTAAYIFRKTYAIHFKAGNIHNGAVGVVEAARILQLF